MSLRYYPWLCLVAVSTILVVTNLVGMKAEQPEKQPMTRILFHRQGTEISIAPAPDRFAAIVGESENLLTTADGGYRLIMTPAKIERLRKTEMALEVIYPDVQVRTMWNGQLVYFTKLLIPLTGEFSPGTVFFAGAYEASLAGKTAEYRALVDYAANTHVRNTRGLDKLKESLRGLGPVD